MAKGHNQHVTPHSGGGWQVIRSEGKKATVRTDTQQKAINVAREIAQNQKTELLIHRPNGQIRSRDSYGNDPFPPKG